MIKSLIWIIVSFLASIYPVPSGAEGDDNQIAFGLPKTKQFDGDNVWPKNQAISGSRVGLGNIFSWEIEADRVIVTYKKYRIKIRVLHEGEGFELSGTVKILHGDIGNVSTASGLLQMGKLNFYADNISLGKTEKICSEISEDYTACRLRDERHEIRWEAPRNPDEFLSEENIPAIVLYDLDGIGAAEIIFQKWGGNRGSPEYMVYQKDGRGFVAPTLSFRNSSELQNGGKDIQTIWSSSACDGNVTENYRSLEGIYTLLERKTYFSGYNEKKSLMDCGFIREKYDLLSKKYSKSKVFQD